MEGYIHLYSKKSPLQIENQSIMNIINSYKGTSHHFNIKKNSKILGVYFTNEYNTYPYQSIANNLFCPVGQFTIDKNIIQETLHISSLGHRLEFVSKLSGAFSISSVDFNNNVIHIYTHVVRAESVYIYEDDDLVIVGSDPLLISILSNSDLKPTLDPSNFISYFEQGYFADELTPFNNVKCLPANSYIKIQPQVEISNIDNTFDTAFTYSDSEELLSEITENFIKAFDIISDKSSTVLSSLTGGKDSRVILLALLEKGYKVNTRTTGFTDHPDVVVAKKLAEILDVPHKTNEKVLNSKNQLAVNLEKRLLATTKASSGLLSAYDTVTTKTEFNDSYNFNGVAASVITGGFNKFNHQVKSTPADSLKRAVYKFNDYYLDENNKYNKFLDQFAKTNDDYQTLLHLFFLLYRTGRWTSDSRISKSYATNSYSIFLDNQLTKSAMKLNMKDLRSEVIHYKLIERLNPDILNIPFANQRFAFEKNGPTSPEDYQNWLEREPIYSKSKVGSYNWRSLGNNDSALIAAFKEIILSRRNNMVFDIVNYSKIEKLLNSKIDARMNKFVWSIASMIKYSDYLNEVNVNKDIKVKLNIPKDNIIKLNTPSKIIDLTNHYHSLNKSLAFNPKTKKILVKEIEGNPYLKIFEGGFNQPAKSLDISDVNSIQFNTNLCVQDLYSDVTMHIIFYTEEKRFKTLTINPLFLSSNKIIFNETMKVPKSAKYFRTAIHFKNKESSTHTLNYSFAKLYY